MAMAYRHHAQIIITFKDHPIEFRGNIGALRFSALPAVLMSDCWTYCQAANQVTTITSAIAAISNGN